MRNFITRLFWFAVYAVAILTLIKGVAFLFDCSPKNLNLAWKQSINVAVVLLLINLLFGFRK